MSLFDRSDSGLVDLDDVFHFVKEQIGQIKRKIFKVPYGEVVFEGESDVEPVTIKNISHQTSDAFVMPASQHFISKPVDREIVPLFSYMGESFYGHPMPIHQSSRNHGKIELTRTKYFKASDVTTRPIEIAPGDVVVQGRLNHSINLGKSQFANYPTIKIANNIHSRDVKKPFISEKQITREEQDLNYPMFYNVNLDGSSIHMLGGGGTGIDLAEEVELSGKKGHKDFLERSLNNTFTPDRQVGKTLNKILISSDHLIFYTKGLDAPAGHNIEMLASGNVFINSFQNVIISTPKTSKNQEQVIGRIQLGNGENPTGLPLSTMQPVVKGVDFQEAMNEVVSIFNFIRSQFKSLANGGIGVDRRGVGHAYSLKGAPIKILERKIETLEKRLSETLSDKVYTE